MYSHSKNFSSRFSHWVVWAQSYRGKQGHVPTQLNCGKDPQHSPLLSEYFVKCKYSYNIPQHENPSEPPYLGPRGKSAYSWVWPKGPLWSGLGPLLQPQLSSLICTPCAPGARRLVALGTVLRDFTFSPSQLCLHLKFLQSFKPVFHCHLLPPLWNILSSPSPNLCWQQSALCWHLLCILCCNTSLHIRI